MNKITLTKDQYNLLFISFENYASKPNSSRFELEHLHLIVSKDTITCCALDGYKLIVLEMSHAQDVTPFEGFLRPCKAPNRCETVSIEALDSKICKVSFKTVEGFQQTVEYSSPASFPDHTKILPSLSDPELEISFDPMLLTKALKPYCTLGNRVKLSFTKGAFACSPVTLTSSPAEELSLKSLVLPLRNV